jgi:hypothetical protein
MPTISLTKDQLAERAQRMRYMEYERAQNAANELHTIVRMGRELMAVRDAKTPIPFKEWVRQQLPFSYESAARYIRVAEKVSTLTPFFGLGKSTVYHLMELPPEKLEGLSPETKFRDVALAAMNCREVERFVAHLAGPKHPGPSPATRGLGAVSELAQIKRDEPEAWEEIADDVAVLLGGPPKPCEPTGHPLTGATRAARAGEIVERLRDLVGAVAQVDDVPGKLPVRAKREVMELAQTLWQAVNKLPAYAVLRKRTAR